MHKSYLYIFSFCVLFIVTITTPCTAQDRDSVIAATEDTLTATPDSIADNSPDSAYYDEEDDENYYDNSNDTLYFLLKNDTTSLYDSSAFTWRAVPDSVTDHLKNNDDFWYANKDLHEKKKEGNSGSWVDKFFYKLLRLLDNNTFRLVMWIIIILCFAAAILWFLSRNKMNIWAASKVAIVREKQDGEVDDIFTTDLKTEILKAEQKQDYRLAIRFHYLHLLKLLSHHALIKYTQDATNMEYLTQLYGRPFYREFFKVTRNYEYAWYGEIAVSGEQYRNVVSEFTELYNKTSISW